MNFGRQKCFTCGIEVETTEELNAEISANKHLIAVRLENWMKLSSKLLKKT